MNAYDDFTGLLLLTDIDGTLLPEGGKIAEEDRAALWHFVQHGGHLGVATGRTAAGSAEYIDDLPLDTPCIFLNGAQLYDWDEQRTILSRPLTPAAGIWPKFAAFCLDMLPEACIEVYTEDGCHIISQPVHDDPRLTQENYHSVHTPLVELRDMEAAPWLKFFICDEPERLREMEDWARMFGIDRIARGFYSEAYYYEFVALDTSKGAMMSTLREMPEWSGYQVIAVGDYMNDVEMLAMADVGVAAGGGHPAAREAADVTGCRAEEHLVAWTIDQLASGAFDRLLFGQAADEALRALAALDSFDRLQYLSDTPQRTSFPA